MTKTALSQLVAAKLASSGLDAKTAKALGMVGLSAKETAKRFPKYPVPSLLLPYFTVTGQTRKDVYRIRLLAPPPPGPFGEAPEKPLRYLQPEGSPPAAYLPRTVAWPEVFLDKERTILITEGELKAACAAAHGFACIGLGGVSSWRSAAQGWALLPELEAIKWTERDVVICFDSDAATNSDVARATAALVQALTHRGAQPRVVQLPQLEGQSKTGLDDFLVAEGRDALVSLLDGAPADELSRALWRFNDRFAFVLSPGLVYDEQLDQRYDPATFKTSLFANVWATQVLVDAEGRSRLKEVAVADAWVKWPQRRQLSKFTYAPGKEKYLADGSLNAWRGWGTEAKEGTVKPWEDLLDILLDGAKDDARAWFGRWCLYPLKFPGTKMFSAAALWSQAQGLGKSLIGQTLGKVYGDNFISISQRELESDFNDWAYYRQLVMVDDMSSHDSRAKADILKKIITQDEQLINVKYQPAFRVPDVVNYYITSNRPNALYLEDHDRRYFVHEVIASRPSKKFFDGFFEWQRGDGPAHLLHHARHEMEFDDFKPYERPPETEAKRAMIHATKSELEAFLVELKEDPDAFLHVGKISLTRDIFTALEVTELFDARRKGPGAGVNVVGAKLRDTFPRAANGATLRPDDKSERFYILRNQQRWLNATRRAIEDHIKMGRDKERGKGKGKF